MSGEQMKLNDRRRGCLLGLAVGDALGAAVEFEPPGTFEPVTDYRAGGPHGLAPGEWTDDTSMALALADSIAEVAWDLNDQAERYVAWWKTGKYSSNGRVFDIGVTTVTSLSRFMESGDAATSGAADEYSSGNGCIMRLAPVPIAYHRCLDDRLEMLADRGEQSSLPTHASPQCLSASRYFAVILAGLIGGRERDEVLAPDWPPLRRLVELKPLHPEVGEISQGSFRARQPPEIMGSGYVIKSLEAALWAFAGAASFREAVLRAVNLGDDADTTGAVCGQLAGAYWGRAGIPQRWLDGLAERALIDQLLDRLLR